MSARSLGHVRLRGLGLLFCAGCSVATSASADPERGRGGSLHPDTSMGLAAPPEDAAVVLGMGGGDGLGVAEFDDGRSWVVTPNVYL